MALVRLPKFQVFDDDTAFLSGGKVYTYEAGTTTPKVTYSDPDCSVENTNPVILDSRGEADIYAPDDETYKFVITDADDVTINTVDDYNSWNQTVSVETDNLIINGNFDVWQDGDTASYNNTTVHTADKWFADGGDGSTAVGTVTKGTFTDTTYISSGAPHYLQLNVTSSAGCTVVGGEIFQNIYRPEFGFLNTGTVTLSFYAKSADNSVPTLRAHIKRGTTYDWFDDSTLTDEWQQFVITKTLSEVNTARDFNRLAFCVPINSTGTFQIAQIRLDLGSVAKDFEIIPYSETLDRCQYFNAPKTYYVDSNQSDQGATATSDLFPCGLSLKSICEYIGTTTKATVVFKHKDPASQSGYHFLTALDLSDYINITFEFENGAILMRTGTPTVTFPSPEHIKAGKRQYLFEEDMVAFDTDGVGYPHWWGAKAENEESGVDSYSSMQRCVDACNQMEVPPGDYTANTDVTISAGQVVHNYGALIVGAFVVNAAATVISYSPNAVKIYNDVILANAGGNQTLSNNVTSGYFSLCGGVETTDGAYVVLSGNTRSVDADEIHMGSENADALVVDASQNVHIPNDSKTLSFGTGDDLGLYHDGSDSYVYNNTGDLYLRDPNTNGGTAVTLSGLLAADRPYVLHSESQGETEYSFAASLEDDWYDFSTVHCTAWHFYLPDNASSLNLRIRMKATGTIHTVDRVRLRVESNYSDPYEFYGNDPGNYNWRELSLTSLPSSGSWYDVRLQYYIDDNIDFDSFYIQGLVLYLTHFS